MTNVCVRDDDEKKKEEKTHSYTSTKKTGNPNLDSKLHFIPHHFPHVILICYVYGFSNFIDLGGSGSIDLCFSGCSIADRAALVDLLGSEALPPLQYVDDTSAACPSYGANLGL